MGDTAGSGSLADSTAPEFHLIGDLTALAATAHPVRRRVLDLFDVDGQATATALARRTGQAVGNITRHLRVLEQAGLTEEAPGPAASGGERRWQRTSGYRVRTEDLPDDPVTKAVILAAHSVITQRYAELTQAWMSAREAFSPGWEASGFLTDRWLRLNPAEIAELREEMGGIFERWANRDEPDDGTDRQPVIVFAQAMRAQP